MLISLYRCILFHKKCHNSGNLALGADAIIYMIYFWQEILHRHLNNGIFYLEHLRCPLKCSSVFIKCVSVTNYLPYFLIGNTVPAVFAIPAANRPGYTDYFIPATPVAYRNQAWMSYAGEHDIPGQWADSVIEQILFYYLYLRIN